MLTYFHPEFDKITIFGWALTLRRGTNMSNNNEELFKQGEKSKEDSLDFEFDDLSEQDLEIVSDDPPSDEEIIDLIDIIESEEIPEGEEIESLLEEDEGVEEKAESEEGLKEDDEIESDLDFKLEELLGADSSDMDTVEPDKEETESEKSGGLFEEDVVEAETAADEEFEIVQEETQDVEEGESLDLEADIDSGLEELEDVKSEEDDADLDLDEGVFDDVLEETVLEDETVTEETTSETGAIDEEEREEDMDVSGLDTLDALVEVEEEVEPGSKEGIAAGEQPETDDEEISPVADKSVGISEEKIEAIVTRVVQDTLERVARETMITVSEKLITEAIDTLKQSLESTPKE